MFTKHDWVCEKGREDWSWDDWRCDIKGCLFFVCVCVCVKKPIAAASLVYVCLPKTRNLFTIFKRRYSSSQVRDLNDVCKLRGLRVSSLERILFLRKCLESSVVPHDIYEKVKRLRPRFAASIGRAFVKNEIVEEEERLTKRGATFLRAWRRAGEILSSGLDWLRFNKLLGENGCRLRTMLRSKYAQRLSWLRTKRFGSEELNEDAVFNLSDVKLSRAQLEILSRGPRFGIPVEKPCREEIFAEFELYFSQLQSRMPKSSTGKEKEKKDGLKASLANLAHEYSNIKQDPLRFPFGKEHIAALRELRNNKEIIITRPDKGNGTVLMNKTDYIARMMEILGDETKFECLGGCDKHDRTGQIERALQAYLLQQRKAGEISNEIYDRIRPTGSVRPRMYGLPKVHKPKPIPLRPILSMVGSAQHELARWLAEVIRPVLNRYSSNVVKDSFSFCADLQDYGYVSDNAFMCSFDVVSLFTNVPIDETVQICLDTLYRSDIKPPSISEGVLKKLLLKATRGVEFSYNDKMYRQKDGVAMGSPLGPVLANIFLGFCECRIPDALLPHLYRRFVDDTFALLDSRDGALAFLKCLNELHPSLQFTMESEDDGQLPFMDVRVRKEENVFTTAVYRKPTFTGLYTRWDSYCRTSQKIALVRSLVQRARKICSPQYLDGEMETLQSIFEKNGYPGPIVSRVIQQTLESEPRPTGQQRKEDKVFIRLPWLGPKSAAFRNRIHRATIDALPDCKAVCTFKTRRMFNTCKKDVLPTESTSNVIYFFSCACEQSYVGRTAQRLEERITHTFLRAWSVRLGLRRRSQRRRRRRRTRRTRERRRRRRRRKQQIGAMTVRMEEARKRTWHWQQLNKTVTAHAQMAGTGMSWKSQNQTAVLHVIWRLPANAERRFVSRMSPHAFRSSLGQEMPVTLGS